LFIAGCAHDALVWETVTPKDIFQFLENTNLTVMGDLAYISKDYCITAIKGIGLPLSTKERMHNTVFNARRSLIDEQWGDACVHGNFCVPRKQVGMIGTMLLRQQN